MSYYKFSVIIYLNIMLNEVQNIKIFSLILSMILWVYINLFKIHKVKISIPKIITESISESNYPRK